MTPVTASTVPLVTVADKNPVMGVAQIEAPVHELPTQNASDKVATTSGVQAGIVSEAAPVAKIQETTKSTQVTTPQVASIPNTIPDVTRPEYPPWQIVQGKTPAAVARGSMSYAKAVTVSVKNDFSELQANAQELSTSVPIDVGDLLQL
ncbi:hypothetical protein K7X08_013387 [Anisodus acutangulus]|uniref:Uncharacterized protein n=1 Tax=Anisodus acutangulus TaxID=402998 RepID=A0A9Q1RHE6_9SOLA|nr:hypothetical protein K7X08_013387 [Anisodus acutangulus]